jgi:hypothetical protein
VRGVERPTWALWLGYGLEAGRAIIPQGRRNGRSAMRLSNKAFKLTRSHGLCRMEALRATMRRLNGPSQLNAMFGGPSPCIVGEEA